jgi:hypothetical protein
MARVPQIEVCHFSLLACGITNYDEPARKT